MHGHPPAHTKDHLIISSYNFLIFYIKKNFAHILSYYCTDVRSNWNLHRICRAEGSKNENNGQIWQYSVLRWSLSPVAAHTKKPQAFHSSNIQGLSQSP
jgi:hypothetical protein